MGKIGRETTACCSSHCCRFYLLFLKIIWYFYTFSHIFDGKQKKTFSMLIKSSTFLRSVALPFLRANLRRNFGASSVALKPAAAATDPIQRLFADKVTDYATKEVEAALQEELDKVAQSFGGGKGIDMTQFPV